MFKVCVGSGRRWYIEFFDEGFCDGGFARGRGACDADYLESEPGWFVFWFCLRHRCSVSTTDAIAILMKGPPENVNIRTQKKSIYVNLREYYVCTDRHGASVRLSLVTSVIQSGSIKSCASTIQRPGKQDGLAIVSQTPTHETQSHNSIKTLHLSLQISSSTAYPHVPTTPEQTWPRTPITSSILGHEKGNNRLDGKSRQNFC